MSLTLAEIRTGIKNTIKAGIGNEINVDDNGKRSPAPAIRLSLDETPSYFETMGARQIQSVRFKITLDPAGTDESAVIRLDTWLDSGSTATKSVVDALDDDLTLGGVAEHFDIEPGAYDDEAVVAEMYLIVHVRGD